MSAASKPAADSSRSSKWDALVSLLAVVGIAILVNAILLPVSARLDLTQGQVHTLSDPSKDAARGLEGVTVTVYISKKLPDSLPTPQGGTVSLKGIERAFRDKLDEYAVASGGNLKLVFAEDNAPGVGTIEEQAEAAKLELFSGTEAQVTGGGELKFARYALGATFHYKTVHEVYAKALEPGFYEFEITKILLRLKEKYDSAQLQKEPLAKGKALLDAVKACNDAVQKAAKVDDAAPAAGLSLGGKSDPASKRLESLTAAQETWGKACGEVEAALGAAKPVLVGKSQFGDTLLATAEQFAQVQKELAGYLKPASNPDDKQQVPPGLAVAQLVPLLEQFAAEVDRSHTNLADSPGRRVVGFLCGHDEFCPFAEREPLVNEQLAGMLGQNNPMAKQIVQAVQQIGQAIDETNAKIGENLFTRKGYAIARVDAGKPIPADVAALIVYAPRKPLSDYDRYQLDQFLLSGRPVVVFAQPWQVELLNLAPGADVGQELRMDKNALTATQHNLGEVLAPYGIELSAKLTLDTKQVETVRLMQLVNRGGLQFQTQKDFPYALIPVADTFDASHALSRSLQQLPMPWATSVEASAKLKADKAFEVVPLISSSRTSLQKSGDVPVLPPRLSELVMGSAPSGPHTLALAVRGPFTSAFAGKDIPAKPAAPAAPDQPPPPADDAELAKRTRKDKGEGRIVVIASNLGIEGLSRPGILAGFDMGKLAQFDPQVLTEFQSWQAGFQNWQIRIGQVSHFLGSSLQFLTNVMDWTTAHEALVAIRSKGETRRPLQQVEPAEARHLRLGSLLVPPILFIAAGLLRWRLRRARNLSLAA